MEIVHSGKIINLLTLLSLNYHTRHTLALTKNYSTHFALLKIFSLSHSLACIFIYLYVCYKLENYLIIFQHFHEYTNERRGLLGVVCVGGWEKMNESEQYDKHFISTAEWCYDNFHNHGLYIRANTTLHHHHHHHRRRPFNILIPDFIFNFFFKLIFFANKKNSFFKKIFLIKILG